LNKNRLLKQKLTFYQRFGPNIGHPVNYATKIQIFRAGKFNLQVNNALPGFHLSLMREMFSRGKVTLIFSEMLN